MEKVLIGYAVLGLSLYLFWRGIGYLKLVRVIQDTPTSTMASASQGMVEVKGKTLPLENQVLRVPGKDLPCVWYRYEKTCQYSGEDSPETEVKESHARFYIEDHTGRCAVDPRHAEVHVKKSDRWFVDACEHVVHWIGADESIYVLGWMQTLHPRQQVDDVIAVRDEKEHRYGQLQDKLERITQPPHNWLPFIISSEFEHRLRNRFRVHAGGFLLAGILLVIMGYRFIT